MKKTLDHYIDILRREKRKKSASYQIKSLGIFGSFAKGEACKKSDGNRLAASNRCHAVLPDNHDTGN